MSTLTGASMNTVHYGGSAGCAGCIGLDDLLKRAETQARPPVAPKQQTKLRFLVQVCGEIPEWVKAGQTQHKLIVQQVPVLKLEVRQTVIAKTYHNEEIIGVIQAIEQTLGPHPKVRLISGARVLNLSASQILAIIREAKTP